jgi:hypothetical protein
MTVLTKTRRNITYRRIVNKIYPLSSEMMLHMDFDHRGWAAGRKSLLITFM